MRRLLPLLALLLSAPVVLAQEGLPPRVMDAPPAEAAGEGRGFESVEAGVAIELPSGERQATGADPSLLAAVVNDDRQWRFEFRRIEQERPIPLSDTPTPQGGVQRGLIDLTVEELLRDAGQGGRLDVLRSDRVPLAEADAGVIAVRYRAGPEGVGSPMVLRQVALVQADEGRHFRLDLVSPAPEGEVEAVADDAAVREAVAAFTESLDSLRLVDQTALLEDQTQRLLRTRSLLVNLKAPGRLGAATAGDGWRRVIRGEEDVGFARVLEEPADRLPTDVTAGFSPAERSDGAADDPASAAGVRVGVRLRMRTERGAIDRRTWSFATRDLAESDFRESNALYADGDGEVGAAAAGIVVGQMRSRRVPRPVETEPVAGVQPEQLIEIDELRELNVTFTLDGAPRGKPLRRRLPPWYVPAAVDHLLPRLVAPFGEKTYMVAVYAPGRREVMNQYVDVSAPRRPTSQDRADLPELAVRDDGDASPRVIVVTTRLGLNGPPTRHYVGADAHGWLGSVNEESGTRVIPATREEIEAIWRDTPMIVE